jgi:hypothetical protein
MLCDEAICYIPLGVAGGFVLFPLLEVDIYFGDLEWEWSMLEQN